MKKPFESIRIEKLTTYEKLQNTLLHRYKTLYFNLFKIF